MGYTSK